MICAEILSSISEAHKAKASTKRFSSIIGSSLSEFLIAALGFLYLVKKG
jgi:hypothetical protein